MKIIQLTQNKSAIVDDEDYEWLSQWKWYVMIGGNSQGLAYAVRDKMKNRKKIAIYMHKLVINAPNNTNIDHINHNTLDNRKQNLRIATHRQNIRNMHQKYNKCGYKGIYKANQKYAAKITVDYKGIYLGVYDTAKKAAEAYDQAARDYFGEFAYLNFPKRGENGYMER